MTKIALFAQSMARISDPTLTSSQYMVRSGHNFGNYAFWYASQLLVDAEIKLFGWSDNEKSLDGCDIILFPAANWLIQTMDLGRLASVLAKTDQPVIIWGLGAQAEEETEEVPVKEGTLLFLREILKRSSKLLVRGTHTQSVLAKAGITDTVVAGCPSLLIKGDPRLGVDLERKLECIGKAPFPSTQQIVIHASCIKGKLNFVEPWLFRLARSYAFDYVVQRPVELIKVILGEALSEEEQEYLHKAHQFLSPSQSFEAFAQDLRARGVIFDDVPSWMLRLRRCDLSLNTRIHGALLSVAAGCPGICIHHDTRTRELCASTAVPSIDHRVVTRIGDDLPRILQRVEFSGSAFDENRREKAALFEQAICNAGGKPSPHLLRIVNGEPPAC